MAQAITTVANKPAWVDLASSDAEASRNFYTKVFSWPVENADDSAGDKVDDGEPRLVVARDECPRRAGGIGQRRPQPERRGRGQRDELATVHRQQVRLEPPARSERNRSAASLEA